MWAVDAIETTPTSAYSAAQAGRHMLAKNLAIELAAEGIRVNTVALAFVETPAYERFLSPEEAQEVLDAVDTFHPLGRRGRPDDVSRRSCSSRAAARAGSPARCCRSTAASSPDARPAVQAGRPSPPPPSGHAPLPTGPAAASSSARTARARA